MTDIKSTKINTKRMNTDGNIEDNYVDMFYIAKNGVRVSNFYYEIKALGNDFFAVLDVAPTGPNIVLPNHSIDFYPRLEYKFKIISICVSFTSRAGYWEYKVTSPVYDKISSSNENTAIAYANGHLTYIDLDKSSPYAYEQLVPAVLEHAVPFGIPYEGFAECSINGVVRYLPRDITPKTELEITDLLTEEEVKKRMGEIKGKSLIILPNTHQNS